MYVFFFLPKVHSPNHSSDFNAQWLKRRGVKQGSALQASVFRNFHILGVIFLKNLKNCAESAEIPAKTKMLKKPCVILQYLGHFSSDLHEIKSFRTGRRLQRILVVKKISFHPWTFFGEFLGFSTFFEKVSYKISKVINFFCGTNYMNVISKTFVLVELSRSKNEITIIAQKWGNYFSTSSFASELRGLPDFHDPNELLF